MQRTVYLIGFGIVAFSVLMGLLAQLFVQIRLALPMLPLLSLPVLFAHPVPPVLRQLLPRELNVLLYWAFTALIVRRLWIAFRSRQLAIPASFTRGPCLITAVCVIAVMLMLAGLLAFFGAGLRPGGLIAQLAGMVAMGLPVIMGWTELRSLAWGQGRSS